MHLDVAEDVVVHASEKPIGIVTGTGIEAETGIETENAIETMTLIQT